MPKLDDDETKALAAAVWNEGLKRLDTYVGRGIRRAVIKMLLAIGVVAIYLVYKTKLPWH